jgi:hypothetical protein
LLPAVAQVDTPLQIHKRVLPLVVAAAVKSLKRLLCHLHLLRQTFPSQLVKAAHQ